MIIDEHRHIGFADSRPERSAADIVRELDELGVDCAIIAPGSKRHDGMSRDLEIEQTLDIYAIGEKLIETGEVTAEVELLRKIPVDDSGSLEASRRYPGRLFGCWFLNPWLAEEYDLARAAVKQDGFKYIKLHPPMHLFAADDALAMEPVMELAAELDVPVWLHSSSGPGCEYWRMVSLARQFPGVNVIAGHVLCGVPEADALSMARATAELPNLYVDLAEAALDPMSIALTNAAPDRLLMSSDDPWGYPLEEYGLGAMMGKIKSITQDNDELRRKVMGDNAARLLKIT